MMQSDELLNCLDQLNDDPIRKYSICLTTDFVAPKWGGVETHSFQLASHLIERGHKVIMIGSFYKGEREGLRILGNGMKVYHLPLWPTFNGDVSFATKYNILPIVRQILVREGVEIVHGHLTTSITAAMVIFYAKLLGLKTVFTEHSHFSTSEHQFLICNKIAQFYLRDTDATIAVSQACKENFSLRTKVSPHSCFVIPNAVDTNKFYPNPKLRSPANKINIVHVSRLAEKKGSDMLVDIIPTIL